MSELPPEPQSRPRTGQSLSEFVAKVLDQLSVSAWLPAALLVTAGWLLAELRIGDGEITQAFTRMSNAGWPTFLILAGAVVLATTVAQAFSFEAIRLLEGYWGSGRLGRFVGDWRCSHHRSRRRRRAESLEKQRIVAFGTARMKMLAAGVPREDVDDVEKHEFPTSEADVQVQPDYEWRSFADPNAIRRIHGIEHSLWHYPIDDYRILPTQLGNTLRSYEERALGKYHDHLESVVSSEFYRLPPNLQSEHDEQRGRLDLYSTLVVISAGLGVASLVSLWPYDFQAAIGLGVGLGASWFFYRAAIASAVSYGSVLMALKKYLESGENR